MDLVKLPRTVVVARILSPELWRMFYHWHERSRRSYLCPGGCLLCDVERPRSRAYCIGRVRKGGSSCDGLLELAGEVMDQLEGRGLDRRNACGWTFRMESRADRPGWKVLAAEQVPTDPVPIGELGHSLAVLNRLPIILEGSSVSLGRDAWLAEVSSILRRRISMAIGRGCVE